MKSTLVEFPKKIVKNETRTRARVTSKRQDNCFSCLTHFLIPSDSKLDGMELILTKFFQPKPRNASAYFCSIEEANHIF